MSRKFPVVRKVPLWSGMTKRFGLVGSVIAIDVCTPSSMPLWQPATLYPHGLWYRQHLPLQPWAASAKILCLLSALRLSLPR